jgi:anti-sigma factor RsiW
MNPHVNEWLAAYHDDELPVYRRQQVEKHLEDCTACRAELESFVELSSLLKVDQVPHQTPPQRFAAQVNLRLPRTVSSRTLQKEDQLPRWVMGIPLVLIIVWAFLAAALKVATFVLTTDQFLGAEGGREAIFSNWIQTESLLNTSASLFLFHVIIVICTSILFAAWMALWLAWKNNQNEIIIKGGVR